MSSSPETPVSYSQFKAILDAALSEYKTKTGIDLTDNPLAKELQSCDSAEAVQDIIQREAKAVDKFRDRNKWLMKWINPSVDVLFTISSTLSAGVSIVRTIRDDMRVALRYHRAAVASCEGGLYRNRGSPRCSFLCVRDRRLF
jgi:hypothetical protein